MDGIQYRCGSGAVAGAARQARLVAMAVASLLAAACSADDIVEPFSPDAPAEAKRTPKGRVEPTSPNVTPTNNPLAGLTLYLDANSNARRQADAWRSTRPADAEQMEKIAARPQAKWLGSWLADPSSEVASTIAAAARQAAVPVLVAYNITNLDCSSGGAASAEAYRTWITRFAEGIGSARVIVILEPDALPAMDCLSAARQQERVDLIGFAVLTLKAKSGVTVYVDAGHAVWQTPAEMARRLLLARVEFADGFSLNVSNFVGTEANTSYGADLSLRLGGKHFVIDTGRNGLGPTADYQWCNPAGRALGLPPSTVTPHRALDAYLWIKPPGESDGTCNGGPTGGEWWPEYALGLAQRSQTGL